MLLKALCVSEPSNPPAPRAGARSNSNFPTSSKNVQYEVSTSTNFVRGPFVEVWQQWEIRNCSISFYIFELESFGIRPLIMRCCDDVRKNEATVLQLEVQDLSSNSPTIIMILLSGPYLANPIKGGSPDHHVQG